MLVAGTATVNITPTQPLALAGFADRLGVFTAVAHPLFLRALALSDGSEKVVLLVADTIWWGADTVAALLQRWAWPDWRPLLHATHTHSAPQTSALFAAQLGLLDPGWLEQLLQQSLLACQQAITSLQPIDSLSLGRGRCFFPVHRRRKDAAGRVLMAPNFSGQHASQLTVLRLAGAGRSIVLLHLACHPTTKGDATVSSEFPGVACELVKQRSGAEQVLFLQGFCGDQRPALIQGDRFFRGSATDVDYLGGVLAEEVLRVLAQPLTPLDCGLLRWAMVRSLLPQQEPLSPAQLLRLHADPSATTIERHWAEQMAKGRQLRPELLLQGLRLGSELLLLLVNAEVVLPYHHLWAGLFPSPHFLSLGYTQGMIGYLPTALYLGEGGYESDESYRYFLLTAPYHEQLEELLKQQVISLARQLYHK